MNWRTTLVLVVIALCLLGFTLLFERKTPSTTERERKQKLVMPGFEDERGKVAKILIERPRRIVKETEKRKNGPDTGSRQRIVLKKAGEEHWDIIEPVRYPADRWRCNGLISDLERLEKEPVGATGELAKAAAEGQSLNPADYMLDADNRIRLVYFKEEGEGDNKKETQVAEIFLSAEKAPGSEFVYAALPARIEKEIYLVRQSFHSDATNALDDFRNTSVFLKLNFSDVQSALLSRPQEPGVLAFEKRNFKWLLRQPLRDRGRTGTVEEALRGVVNLYADRFVEDEPKDLARYGLDNPRYRLTLTDNDRKSMTLVVGNDFIPEEQEEGEEAKKPEFVYVMREGEPTVLTANNDFLDGLSKPLNDYRDDTFATIQPENVNRLVVERAGEPAWDIRKAAGDWKFVEPAPYDADDRTVADFVADFKNLKIKDYLPAGVKLEPAMPGAVKVAFHYEPAAGIEPEAALIGQASEQTMQARRLYLGENPDNAEYDPQNVFFIEAGKVYALLTGSITAFRNRDIFKYESDKAKSIEIVLAAGARYAAVKEADKWKLEQPQAPADKGRISDILWKTSALRAKELVGELEDAQLAGYGLDKPAATLTVKTDEKTLALLLGNEEKDKGTFAKLADGKMVFMLDGGDSGLLALCREGIAKKPAPAAPQEAPPATGEPPAGAPPQD